jgi:excinuclease UvrABC nuclease subunit
MGRKTVKYTKEGISNLPNSKPSVYKILTPGEKINYVGVAKRGRLQERLQEHLQEGDIPGAKIQIQQKTSIQEAKKTEDTIIRRSKPKYNEKGK